MKRKIISLAKRIIFYLSKLLCHRTKMSGFEARKILEDWSPCPNGTCKGNNKIDIKYDLQVIVPVYNVENYIYVCLKSICLETTKYKCLVTVVNDGSTDNSLSEIERFQSDFNNKLRDNNIEIEIINQINGGISSARNRGLDTIRGRYVMFVDSDDVITTGTINGMLDLAYYYNADIVQGNWYDFIDDPDKIIEEHRFANKNDKKISGYPWGKIYKSTVLKNFRFPEGFWFEDTPISFILGSMPYLFVNTDIYVYGYRINPKGITALSRNSKKSVDSYWITEKSLEEFSEFGLNFDEKAYDYLLHQTITNWWRTKRQPGKVRKAIFVLTCELVDKYFKTKSTNDIHLEKIEYLLRKRQYFRYELTVMSMD